MGRRKKVLPMKQVISDYESGMTQKTLAKKYGVSIATIQKRIYEKQGKMKNKVNAKPKIDAKTITLLKNQMPLARILVAKVGAESKISGEVVGAGGEVAFFPKFGIITKSEFELFKKQFC